MEDARLTAHMNKALVFKLLFHDKLVLRVLKGHPLSDVKNITPVDILKYPIIDFGEKNCLNLLKKLSKKYTNRPVNFYSIVESYDSCIDDYLVNDHAVVFDYAFFANNPPFKNDAIETVVIPLDDDHFEFNFGFFYLNDNPNLWIIEQYM